MREATTTPENCAAKNGPTNSGSIPVNASVNALAIVTAGLAKEVDDVNQYPAEIYRPAAGATETILNCRKLRMTIIIGSH